MLERRYSVNPQEMNLNRVTTGDDVPHDVNFIIDTLEDILAIQPRTM
jgi:hypothetical protein